jgi:hypothetical protein
MLTKVRRHRNIAKGSTTLMLADARLCCFDHHMNNHQRTSNSQACGEQVASEASAAPTGPEKTKQNQRNKLAHLIAEIAFQAPAST